MINRGLGGVNTCPQRRIPHGTLAKMPHTVALLKHSKLAYFE
jgi:hypothetical protein